MVKGTKLRCNSTGNILTVVKVVPNIFALGGSVIHIEGKGTWPINLVKRFFEIVD